MREGKGEREKVEGVTWDVIWVEVAVEVAVGRGRGEV